MIWTARHDKAIDRTYLELMDLLKVYESVEEAKEKLNSIKWPHGTAIQAEGPSGRVKRELANLAIIEHAKCLLLKAVG